MLEKDLTMLDLFAGAGGLSEGLSEAGFHSLFASEIIPTYAETYRKNHPSSKVLTADIRTVDAEAVREQLNIKKGELDLLAGGPPCQGFSINAPVRSVYQKPGREAARLHGGPPSGAAQTVKAPFQRIGASLNRRDHALLQPALGQYRGEKGWQSGLELWNLRIVR